MKPNIGSPIQLSPQIYVKDGVKLLTVCFKSKIKSWKCLYSLVAVPLF